MNYRHAYHAGNFADVLKHVILARVVTYLKQKPQPFRVIDLHAGAGRYDLASVEAGKTSEWLDGIRRLIDADIPDAAATLIAPYLDAVDSVNESGTLKFYPGSPLIARHLMRSSDTLVANELHPEDAALLKSELWRTANAKLMTLNAWTAIKALLPPPERRGIVLIDPPFEQPDEFAKLTDAMREGLQRFANGVYVIWYPVKNASATNRMLSDVSALGCRKVLDVRLKVAQAFPGLGLTETGVLILNPPFNLAAELAIIMPVFVAVLGQDRSAAFELTEPFANA